MPTAAAIVIGHEILTGKFRDENGPYLIDRLRALGCDLRRLATVEDDVGDIADEVRLCAGRYDFVFTSGGVGPTHDDVTLEGVARAFDVPLVQHEELVALMRRWEHPENPSTLRMANLPQGTELVAHARLAFPVLRVRNVWIFPGVPRLLREKFENVADRFAGQAVSVARVYTDEHESAIAERLAGVARRHPAVEIGSYPRFGEGAYKVILTLESRDEAALARAREEVVATLSVVVVQEPG